MESLIVAGSVLFGMGCYLYACERVSDEDLCAHLDMLMPGQGYDEALVRLWRKKWAGPAPDVDTGTGVP